MVEVIPERLPVRRGVSGPERPEILRGEAANLATRVPFFPPRGRAEAARVAPWSFAMSKDSEGLLVPRDPCGGERLQASPGSECLLPGCPGLG